MPKLSPSACLIPFVFVLLVLPACAQTLPACEWCGVAEAPPEVSWATTIHTADEPGEPLTIRGTIYASDGKTPVPGVLLYVYHTNAEGVYPKRGDERGNAQRHGYLRGWLLTNSDGQYHFQTIRPASYPNRREPAHIHMTVQPRAGEEDWIDTIVFDDDPLVNANYRSSANNKGGSGIITLTGNAQEGWQGVRDIVLKP